MKLTLLGLGESTSRGWPFSTIDDNPYMIPKIVKEAHPNHFDRVINKAIAGCTSIMQSLPYCRGHLLHAMTGPLMDFNLAGTKGDLVVMNVSINDAWQATPFDDYESNMVRVLDRLKRSGKLVVVHQPIASVHPVDENNNTIYWGDGATGLKDGMTFPQRLEHIAGLNVDICDDAGVLLQGGNTVQTCDRIDWCHQTQSEYLRMGGELATFVGANIDLDYLLAEVRAAALYVTIYDQLPTAAELEYWANRQDTVPFITGALATEMLASSIGQYNFPTTMTDSQFIEKVYLKAANRIADAGGLAYWVSELGSKSRGEVLSIMLNGFNTYGLEREETLLDAAQGAYFFSNRYSLALAWARNFGKTTNNTTLLNSITADPQTLVAAGDAI